MAINFAAASTAGLNNPGTEIITLVKDGGGNFINPPSYDKMRAYLRSGDVPMLFVSAEGGETGSWYQLAEYSETENKIRFSNDTTAIEFSAGGAAPVVSDVGGASSDDVFIIRGTADETFTTAQFDKTPEQIFEAYQSGKYCLANFDGTFFHVTTVETAGSQHMMRCYGFTFSGSTQVEAGILELTTGDGGATWAIVMNSPILLSGRFFKPQISGDDDRMYTLSVDANGNLTATAVR